MITVDLTKAEGLKQIKKTKQNTTLAPRTS